MKKSPQIKVCGMTDLHQVAQLAELGVNYAGFIFYEKSPRYVAGKIEAPALKELNAIKKTGVFVNADVERVLDCVAAYGLDYVQLHGDESREYCNIISKQVKIIKVLRVGGAEDLQALVKGYDTADMFLFDTKTKEYGGSGKKFDWTFLKNKVVPKRFFLSGGIGPDDVQPVLDFARFNDDFILDLNSKFEDSPGLKNLSLLKTFIAAVKKSGGG